jgi:hypothetical protein
MFKRFDVQNIFMEYQETSGCGYRSFIAAVEAGTIRPYDFIVVGGKDYRFFDKRDHADLRLAMFDVKQGRRIGLLQVPEDVLKRKKWITKK